MENYKEDRQIALFMCLIFVASAALLMVRHEMWRDEIQPWLVIRDINSIREILSYLKYELHPFLWYALLYPLKFVTRNPEIMKPLHLLIASITVYIFCRNAPFSRLNKLLFVLGYFPFFEYSIIARDYSLVQLFLFLLIVMYIAERANPNTSQVRLWGITGAVFLICQTHLLGVLIGGFFSCLIIWDFILTRERKTLIPLFGFLIGVAIFVAQLFPPQNLATSSFTFGLSLDRMTLAAKCIWRGFFPVPIPFLHFWHTNILDVTPFLLALQSLLGLLVLVGSIFFIMTLREQRSLLVYCVGVFSLLILIYLTVYIPIRFLGFFMILFMSSLWIGYGLKDNICRSKVISLLLFLHVIANSVAYYYDMRYPFSASKQAAEFIKDLKYQELVIVGYRNAPVSPLAGYLDAKFYYPQSNSFGSFITYDETWRRRLTVDEVFQKAKEVRASTEKPVLVVLNSSTIFSKSPNHIQMPESEKEERWRITEESFAESFTFLEQFAVSIVTNEVYSIWLVE